MKIVIKGFLLDFKNSLRNREINVKAGKYSNKVID